MHVRLLKHIEDQLLNGKFEPNLKKKIIIKLYLELKILEFGIEYWTPFVNYR